MFKLLLKVEHLTYKVDNRTILDDINLNINKGDTIAIVGPSGSGKSTLLKQLNHLISPTSGDLYLNDQSYFDYKPEEIRTRVSYLMQQSELIGYTIEDNMKFPAEARNEAYDRDKAKQLISQVGLGNYQLDAQFEHMSGGEQQRVSVARALINNPTLILADEPSGNLDSENATALHQLFFDLRDKMQQTFVIVTHNEELARISDRTIHMRDGLIY